MNKYSILLTVSLFNYILCQKKDLIQKPQTLYASSLFRSNQVLEGVPILKSLVNVSVSICLLNCMKRKPECNSFNWGNGECALMSDSYCFNETMILTPRDGYAYYDIMDSPEEEKKHLKDGYCRLLGKCSSRCYPRTPHFVDTALKHRKAKEFCESLGRTLPMPTSLEEQKFFKSFAKKQLSERPGIRNTKDMKFWIGISDELVEETWMYDDETPVSEKFSAWGTGQPDNGGPYGGSGEDCGALSEKGEFTWSDVSCNIDLKFFCA